jgi:hypothetical protein
LPPTIRQSVLDRVDLLPAATRQLLECGAVLGREFSAASIARMSDSFPAQVIDMLNPARRGGLISEIKPEHFMFAHSLIRDAIDDALGAEQRAVLHGRADAALAVLDQTADVLVERARHALAALRSGHPTDALTIADRASSLQERECAFDRAFEGMVPRLLGMLDAALGDLAGAELGLREAHTFAVERGHAPWVAQTAYELAKLARCRGRESQAHEWLAVCAKIARELGMTGLVASAAADLETNVDASPVKAMRPTAVSREGAIWKIERDARVARVRDSRGMRLLARLVERPNEEIHVLALASDDPAASVGETSAGEVLDRRARTAYRKRLAGLAGAVAAAERRADAGQAAMLERERSAIHRELARATGLGGRARQAGSATERARVNVQRRLKNAIACIAEADEALGRFFEAAVCTGTFCCFRT